MSTPAVVFSLGFTYDWAIGGYDFLEYMDRPEAFDKTRHLMTNTRTSSTICQTQKNQTDYSMHSLTF